MVIGGLDYSQRSSEGKMSHSDQIYEINEHLLHLYHGINYVILFLDYICLHVYLKNI